MDVEMKILKLECGKNIQIELSVDEVVCILNSMSFAKENDKLKFELQLVRNIADYGYCQLPRIVESYCTESYKSVGDDIEDDEEEY